MPTTPRADRGTELECAARDPYAAAHALALRLLERRAHSRAELAAALARRGLGADVTEPLLRRLAEVGLIDDAGYAETLVASGHRGRGLARRALMVELRRRGIGDEDADAALSTIGDDDEEARARLLLVRRARSSAGVDREVRARRLLGMLARKGYPAELAVRLVGEVLDAEGARRDEAHRVIGAHEPEHA